MNHHRVSLLSALVALAFSGTAAASGFQLIEQNASGIGNAYAGSAAVAENASTIFYNPAGMTQLKDHEVSFGLAMVKPSFKFKNKGSEPVGSGTMAGVVSGATPHGNGGDGGSWAAVPDAYMSWALNKDLYIGLGISAPFGLMTEYDKDWLGSTHSIKFDIKTYNFNPSVAWKVNEQVSLGFGVNYMKMEVEYTKLAAQNLTAGQLVDAQAGAGACTAMGGAGAILGPLFGLGALPPAAIPCATPNVAAGTTPAKLKADADAWGWNIGALIHLTPETKLGLSYRSKVKQKLDGTLTVQGQGKVDAKASVELPDTAIVSLTHKLNDRWELLGDVSWTGWSSIPKVIIKNSLANQTLGTKFDDTWRVAVGANYQIDPAVKLKFGLAYDQSPVPNDQNRLVSLPDNDRVWFSFGAQWKPTRDSALDFGVAYLYVKDTKIDNNGNLNADGTPNTVNPTGRIKGDYDNNAWIVGLQYSFAF
ncbi:MAG: outer membrane protein transport protein [Azonexus sp.]|jgi:long-chain fatty acid transport protein|nr:outer membrane protein transport protein [Azonexus sp.]